MPLRPAADSENVDTTLPSVGQRQIRLSLPEVSAGDDEGLGVEGFAWGVCVAVDGRDGWAVVEGRVTEGDEGRLGLGFTVPGRVVEAVVTDLPSNLIFCPT